MLHGVQRHTTQHVGGIVAKKFCRVGVRRLVHSNGKNKRYGVNGDVADDFIHI
jgi:hypothetical protein